MGEGNITKAEIAVYIAVPGLPDIIWQYARELQHSNGAHSLYVAMSVFDGTIFGTNSNYSFLNNYLEVNVYYGEDLITTWVSHCSYNIEYYKCIDLCRRDSFWREPFNEYDSDLFIAANMQNTTIFDPKNKIIPYMTKYKIDKYKYLPNLLKAMHVKAVSRAYESLVNSFDAKN